MPVQHSSVAKGKTDGQPSNSGKKTVNSGDADTTKAFSSKIGPGKMAGNNGGKNTTLCAVAHGTQATSSRPSNTKSSLSRDSDTIHVRTTLTATTKRCAIQKRRQTVYAALQQLVAAHAIPNCHRTKSVALKSPPAV